MRRIAARQTATRKSFAVALVIALAAMTAVGIAVYNLDNAYIASKFNLVTYVPDRIQAGGDTTVLIMAMDNDGKPMANQPVDVLIKTDKISELAWRGVTDRSGFASPSVKAPEESGTVTILVQSGREEMATTTVVDDSIRLIITTDKPIYQPGQIIHMRVLSFAGAHPLPQESNITLEIIDPNGDKIFKKQLQANEYGIASYDLALSDQMSEGNYEIKASSGERSASKVVIVKYYVLPKFKVSIWGLNDWYLVTQSINAQVEAEYFFGQYVLGKVSVEASVYYGVWTKVYNTTGWMSYGIFPFNIPAVRYAIGIPEAGGNGYLQLNVSVTDTGGHTETRSKVIPIAQQPVTISVLADNCVNGQMSTFYAVVRTPDGKPMNHSSVSADLYYSEGGSPNTVGPVYTDDRGIAQLTFQYTGQAYGWFRAYAGTQSAYVRVEFGDGTGVKVLSDKSSYGLGDAGNFTVIYSGDSFTSNVYYDVVSRGYVVDRGVLELKDDRATLRVQMVPEMQPFAQVRVYKIERDLDVARDAVTFQVGTSSALSVNVTTNNSSYYPRDSVEVAFDVRESGEPVLAALGVSIVDEAVFEVGSQFQGFEELIFGLDQEFIQPQYQILSYVYSGAESLPSVSDGVVSELDTARMANTWAKNMENAEALKSEAVQGYWLSLLLVTSIGIVALTLYSVRRGKGLHLIAVPLVVGAVVLLATMYVSVLGFSGSSSQEPRNPNVLPGRMNWGLAPTGIGGFDNGRLLEPEESGSPSQSWMSTDKSGSRPAIVRNYFPETWYWNPCLLTDDNGHANISLTAPDSITSWNVDVIASTIDGVIGTGNGSIKVFQPFFIDPDIPVSVVRGDRFDLKVQVYNYYNETQNVTVTLVQEPWFTLLSPVSKTITVGQNYVSYVNFTIVAEKVGWRSITIEGSSSLANDSVEKPIRVVPDGTSIKTLFNGELENSAVNRTLLLDPSRIEGSENAWVKLQGGIEAVLLEGVEAFIQFVSGCGEQSLSTLSIDILAYDTVKQMGTAPERLFTYESTVNQGIMHELTFLLNATNGQGRGIVWFPGDQDVHPWLTSWALIAFQDAINAGFGLDEDIISDMQSWLKSIQNSDGSWQLPDWGIYEFNNPLLKSKKIAATAYIARALLRSGVPATDSHITNAVGYVEAHIQEVWQDPFSLALSLITLQVGGGSATLRTEAAAQLDSLKKALNDTYYWSSDTNLVSDNGVGGAMVLDMWGGHSSSRVIETTGYAAIALHGEAGFGDVVAKAVKYLLNHRQEFGGWYSTQDTIVAFHALKEVSGSTSIEEVTVTVSVEGVEAFSVVMNRFNRDVTYYVDLRPYLANTTNVSVSCTGTGSILYSVFLEQYVPWSAAPPSSPYLSLTVTYDATHIWLNDEVEAHMHLLYSGPAPALKMILVDLRAPMGLRFDLGEFEQMVDQGLISAYGSNARQVLVYLTNVKTGVPVDLNYTLTPEMPIKSTVQDISAWDMYDPNGVRADVMPVVFEVT